MLNISLLNQQHLILIFMPILSGAIGWFTNFIAVKMLLKPLHPVKILGITFQGLLPRRHEKLATHLAAAIAKDFFTEKNIENFIDKADTGELIDRFIKDKWDDVIKNIVTNIPMLQMFLSEEMIISIRDKVAETFGNNKKAFNQNLVEAINNKVDLEGTIKENILAFDLERLEKIIEDIAQKEFRYIERLGGVIGFIIGLIQAVLVVAFF
ncbi:MAG: DUF445 family protein [Fibrobacteria bacterium]|nr:DUF445 family protein [Fibrobacteria bacterium]